MLGKHAAKSGHARLGLAVRGLAFAPFEFLATHWHPGVVGLNVENIGIARLGGAFLAQPFCHIRTDAQDFALDLALSHDNAPHFLKMKRGFLVAGLVGTFQANEPGQRGSVAAFQAKGLIGGMVALFLAGVVVVGAPQDRVPEDALDLDGLPTFTDFAGLGLVSGVDFVGGFLEELADKIRSGFENGVAQEFFQIGDVGTTGLGGAEGVDQLLDFLLAGEVEDFLV